ncbi:hypothetical protein F5Y06DRAFT_308342 [Hypoxylon sp. FL0890]|nr:hypothetical protein F5Y06DRAFT_308342 [Hypoxylon sp. FL0890]
MADEYPEIENEVISFDEVEESWRGNSTPKRQFEDLILQEMDRIWESDPQTEGRPDKHLHVNAGIQGGWLYDLAFQEVKAQWVEQGIWKESWEYNEGGPGSMDLWKHEEPLQCVFLDPPKQTGHEARHHPKWKAEIIRQHEASRPINQFIYQLALERERLMGQEKEDASTFPDDINTQAYEIVHSRWVERHIWDEEWGLLPGMTWRHEQPPPEALATESEVDTDYSELPPLPAVVKQRKKHDARVQSMPAIAETKETSRPQRISNLELKKDSKGGKSSKRPRSSAKFADSHIETY